MIHGGPGAGEKGKTMVKKKRNTWQSKLTKKQLSHLRAHEIRTFTQAKKSAEFQAQRRKEMGFIQCPDCWDINVRLELPL